MRKVLFERSKAQVHYQILKGGFEEWKTVLGNNRTPSILQIITDKK